MDLRALVDDMLEVSVVGSWTRAGYEVRRRLFDWADPPPRAMAGRTALVTGPTSGLGRATAQELAALGARVILLGRSKDRLARVRDELIATYGADRFPTVVADMSSRTAVHEAVEQILEREERLDVLVDNAGTIYPDRTLTADGIEATLATMVVNPFVLVSGLLPLLQDAGGRVISVATGGMYLTPLDLDDLRSETGAYNGTVAYARAKRAQIALAREWARRLRARASGVRVNAMHPGWADTPSLAEFLPGFHGLMRPALRTAAEGADTITWLAAAPDAGARGGQFFLDRQPRPFDRIPATRLSATDRRRLWDAVVALSGVEDPLPEGRST
jgi:NAD(P)-dependent dehydrogenase (short-subunit alcohol dehydrogenase family)